MDRCWSGACSVDYGQLSRSGNTWHVHSAQPVQVLYVSHSANLDSYTPKPDSRRLSSVEAAFYASQRSASRRCRHYPPLPPLPPLPPMSSQPLVSGNVWHVPTRRSAPTANSAAGWSLPSPQPLAALGERRHRSLRMRELPRCGHECRQLAAAPRRASASAAHLLALGVLNLRATRIHLVMASLRALFVRRRRARYQTARMADVL
jgi:hypothetical protein